MLVPKRAKYRKQHRGTMKGNATAGTTISFGEFGLMSEGTAWVTSRQIEAARRAMTRYCKRGGKIWIRIFPHTPVTRKPDILALNPPLNAYYMIPTLTSINSKKT